MQRIDGFYLYTVGYSINPLRNVASGDPFQKWIVPFYIAERAVSQLLGQSVFGLQVSQTAGQKLWRSLSTLTDNPQRTAPITPLEVYEITSALNEFEHVLAAEFGLMHIYLVLKKRGYNTTDLIESGMELFPSELAAKVPEVIPDINAATRCIAFELPTAAGFHLHRANESVLHRYYDAVTGGKPRPSGRSIGDYIKALKDLRVSEDRLLSALRDLKDLHRNPLIHPQDSLESIDEAIALLGSIQAVIVPMLKVIQSTPVEPEPETKVESSVA